MSHNVRKCNFICFNHVIFTLVDWSELDDEEQYRQRLREQQQSADDQLIDWEDDKEREYRRRYIDHKYFVHTFSNITLYPYNIDWYWYDQLNTGKGISLISRNKHLEEVNWKEYQAEEESRERMKRIQVICYFQLLHGIRYWSSHSVIHAPILMLYF